jgi:hypothetical protein
MLVTAWGRNIASFYKRLLPIGWISISCLLLGPILLAFLASEYVVHGTTLPLQKDYLYFNMFPLWWLESLERV